MHFFFHKLTRIYAASCFSFPSFFRKKNNAKGFVAKVIRRLINIFSHYNLETHCKNLLLPPYSSLVTPRWRFEKSLNFNLIILSLSHGITSIFKHRQIVAVFIHSFTYERSNCKCIKLSQLIRNYVKVYMAWHVRRVLKNMLLMWNNKLCRQKYSVLTSISSIL